MSFGPLSLSRKPDTGEATDEVTQPFDAHCGHNSGFALPISDFNAGPSNAQGE